MNESILKIFFHLWHIHGVSLIMREGTMGGGGREGGGGAVSKAFSESYMNVST